MERRQRLSRFVGTLVDSSAPSHFRNPYAAGEAVDNLLLFLSRRDHLERTVLLVGEAPGYRGAALSGVPLSSISTLTDPWGDPWGSFGPRVGYRVPSILPYRREATATVVWQSLAELFADTPLPLTWNAVPYHPWRGGVESNRTLPRTSLELGRPWLERLLDLFPNARPVAVGLRACEALCSIGAEHSRVRHPSRGGKEGFVSGLRFVRASIIDVP